MTSRLPRLAAWVLAAAVLAALTAAVWVHLDSSGGATSMSGMDGMSGMGGGSGMDHSMGGMDMGGATEALTRAGGNPLGPLLGRNLIMKWQLDSIALAVIVIMLALYVTGIALARARNDVRWSPRRTASFALGLVAIGFATCGSVAVYDQVLFSAHMIGHLLLVMVAPALIVGGHPLSLSLAAATPAGRERIAAVARGRLVSLLTAPPVALAAYTVVIVGSHLTGVMDSIMSNAWAGQVEHLVYLLVGVEFFVLVVGVEPIRWRLGTPARWLLLAIAMAVDTFTGIVLLQGTKSVAMVMNALAAGWLRRVDTVRADRKGWLEQARVAEFTSRTAAAGDVETHDDDEAARESYNDWLAKLDHR